MHPRFSCLPPDTGKTAAGWAGGRSSHAPSSSSSSSPKAFLRFLRRLVPFGWSQSVSLSVWPPPKITSRYWYLYSSHRAWARPGLFWRENVPRSYLLQPTEVNIRPVNGIWEYCFTANKLLLPTRCREANKYLLSALGYSFLSPQGKQGQGKTYT